MKINVIGIVGIPANYGGFETLVDRLVSNKQNNNVLYRVFCSKKEYTNHPKEYNGAILEYINVRANGLSSIIYDILSLIKSIRNCDAVLVLGVSGCLFLPIFRILSNATIITNIDGLEHKRDKWNLIARKFLKISEYFAIKFSHKIICDNKGIYDYVLSEYRYKSNLIAYGGDHVYKKEITEDTLKTYLIPNKYFFKVCRIEPENSIHLILDAFSKLPTSNLVIVGNWNNSKYGVDLRNQYSNFSNIRMLDPIYDQDVLNQLRSNCYVYIHGHTAGGTNPSLVEAMFLHLPIIAFDVVYNRETTNNCGLYFKNVEDLITIVNSLDDIELEKVSSDLLDVAKLNYRWGDVIAKYENLFTI